MPATVSEKTIGRLSLYRRLLYELRNAGEENLYSHQLAQMAGVTAAQVRRDLMSIGYSGSPTRGYDVRELGESIGRFLDSPTDQGVALVGVGNLGRAIMAFFAGRRPHLRIVAAFDTDPYKVNRVIQGVRCYSLEQMPQVVESEGIQVGILAVPAVAAQSAADTLVRAGVRGLLNFAPVPLRVPPDVYVEDIDMTMSLEKVAYFARQRASQKELQTW
ncbi:MAG TPA: redox-sensing transcriptional repressor Rex [Phycisphaerales bacterium]|nr:redox-sensing transcriptional repressor Rex [Phycisphaerales bacterium]